MENVPALEWLDPRNALHIPRILQEAFSNIIKHTKATEIRVATSCNDEHVRVIVIDNGQGFSVQPLKAGKGLSNQLSRANSIGAKIQIESSESGTRLTLVMPIRSLSH
ncbi:ATP-binding protein [Pseudomonas syringae]|uniref:sensor histidine kinase n=1 Tax=Pseudomonas syringae TaxID=317 RepID=UPI0009B03B36